MVFHAEIHFSGKETNGLERALSIIKPDGVTRGLIGDVIRRL
ncbi:MAG: hypothetical protein JRI76_14620, partial [Deltaproteobacteria bacterium]|nr:hypothetical protein [Deltaproteobacteria bacterium]